MGNPLNLGAMIPTKLKSFWWYLAIEGFQSPQPRGNDSNRIFNIVIILRRFCFKPLNLGVMIPTAKGTSVTCNFNMF